MSSYLIVGASSGIGKALAHKLAETGLRVYGTFNTRDESTDHPNLSYHHLNVLDEVLQLDFLPDTLSGLVYCPGTIDLKPFKRISPADFVADYELQVVGAIKTIQAVLPKLQNSANATITLFSTVAVELGMPFHSKVAASKGALEGLTRALDAEFAPKVRVNCIAPSLTDTPLAASLLNSDQKREAGGLRHPMKRVGTTADIANLAEFLMSDSASWITGQIMHVDGGMSALRT